MSMPAIQDGPSSAEPPRRANLPAVYQRVGAEALRAALKKMHLIRLFEEGAEQQYMRGLIHGTMHLSIGQEASAVGICMPLTDADYITSTHRGHGHCIAKGADVGRMFAEFFGKETGYCHGRGGSMHIADVAKGNLGANGIVGGGIPIAVGAALTAKRQKTDRVVISFFGDGANNEGAFHEALNMASAMEAAGGVRLREQPLRHVGLRRNARPRSSLHRRPRGGQRHAGRHRGRQRLLRRRRGCRSPPSRGRAKVARARRSMESQDLPHGAATRSSDRNRYRTKDEIAEWRGARPDPRVRDGSARPPPPDARRCRGRAESTPTCRTIEAADGIR